MDGKSLFYSKEALAKKDTCFCERKEYNFVSDRYTKKHEKVGETAVVLRTDCERIFYEKGINLK